MLIIYYSNAENTHRFVNNHLWGVLIKDLDIDRDRAIKVSRILAPSPHDHLTAVTSPTIFPIREGADDHDDLRLAEIPLTAGEPVLIVTPTYGRFNHEIGAGENYTPLPVKEVASFFSHPSQARPVFYATGGNRTFGPDFVKQDGFPFPLIHAGSFELSGSWTEALEIAATVKAYL
ncbi:MAG: hypothetical protein PHW63_08920 [Alphaproteobacteria bacterium]|nr:hypothetical protein [Alphaproteobacteria bacterium]